MNRRQALRNIGLGAGFLVVGPTTMSLLKSCKGVPDTEWEPSFLSKKDAFALQEILEVILPQTDTPGSKELNLAFFIDSYFDQVAGEEEQEDFRRGAESFRVLFESEFQKEVNQGNQEEFEKVVARFLTAAPEERERFARRNTETQDPMDSNIEEEVDPSPGAFAYVSNVRSLGIWAWKNSEVIGEKVLWYDPVPGQYIPCGSVEEFGNGRAMSL